MAGHDMAQMLMENAAAAPGRQVDALAWCYWSKSNRPDGSGVSFVGDCDLYSTKLSPDEVTQAQALAAT